MRNPSRALTISKPLYKMRMTNQRLIFWLRHSSRYGRISMSGLSCREHHRMWSARAKGCLPLTDREHRTSVCDESDRTLAKRWERQNQSEVRGRPWPVSENHGYPSNAEHSLPSNRQIFTHLLGNVYIGKDRMNTPRFAEHRSKC